MDCNSELSQQELEESERRSIDTAKRIYDLKSQVAVLLKKGKLTEVEKKDLEETNKQLSELLALFDSKTKKIRFLINQTSHFKGLISPKPRENFNEDMLPKVIICGIADNNIPRIIVCNNNKKSKNCCADTTCFPVPQTRVPPQLGKKLSESYTIQKRLAAEDATLK